MFSIRGIVIMVEWCYDDCGIEFVVCCVIVVKRMMVELGRLVGFMVRSFERLLGGG